MPVEAAIVAKHEFIEITVDVLAAQAVICAKAPSGWGWCYVDEVMFDLSDRATPQDGPIPRYY